MAPSFSSSPLTAAAVAASPTPASANSSNTSPGHTTFRSLRSLLPFGPSKNASNNSHPSSSSSPQGNPSRGTFSGFGSMRKSLTRERERQTSLTNLLPVISIDKPSSSAPQSQDDGAVRRAASFSTIDTSTTNASLLQNVVLDLPTGLGSSPSLNSTRSTDTAPILRSISPGPPLSADLSTIIEADSSYMSKTEPRSSKPSSPTIEKALPDIPPPRADRMNNDQDASLDLNTTHLAEQVLDAIMEKDAVTVEGWLNADKPIVIDADTDEDVDVDVPLGPVVDNASINIESVDPSIVALLSPNNLPRRGDRALQPNLPSDDASLIQESNASSSNTPSPAMQPRKASPTFSSIPRLRTMIHEPTTPGGSPSAGSDTTFKGSTTTPTGAANGMQQPNRSDGSLVQRRRIVSPSPLSGYSTPDLKTNSIPAAARSRMIGRSWSGSHSHSSVSSAPVTPSSSTQNLPLHPRISSSSARLQVQIPSQTTNTRPLSQSRTPSPILHAPPLHSPQSSYTPAMTSASTSSVPNLVPTAPATPSTPNSIIRLAPGVSRQNSESSHSLKPKFDTVDDTTTSMTSYGGRASLDSRRTRLQASNSETHVLATSTPFRRSSDDATATSTATTTTTRRKSMSSDTTTSPTSTRFGGRRPSFRDGYLAITRSRHASDAKEDSFSPSSLAVASKDGRPASPSLSLSPNSRVRSALSAPFRTRKRSMSVQESHGVFPASVISKRPDALLAAAGGRFTAGLRSSSSLSGRLANVKNKDLREESEEGGGGNGNSASRPPLHDWLGPRSVKALRAAGLLDYDREERDRDGESQHQYQYHHHMASLHSSSRERSGSVTTSVLSGASSSGRTGGPLTRFVSPTTNRSSASEYSPQHGRAQSRMAFSDAGGGGPGSIAGTSSRRGSETFSYPHGVGVGGQGLMHSPTFTTSTSGSRDRESRDTARSAGSTAPTSVSSSPYAYLSREREGRNREGDSGSRDRLPDRDRERDRDEVRELKEKHATETGALLGALSDSQRTTRMLREENGDLRERLERFADVEVENEELRKEVRGLRREVSELKMLVLRNGAVAGGGGGRLSGGGGNGWASGGMTGRRSGLNTPVDERYLSRSDLELVEHTEDTRVYASRESLHPPSISHGRSRSPATTATPSPSKHSPSFVHPDTPETPRHRHHHHHHHRSTSDSSSIFPALPSNMTMLMHEDNNMLMVDQGSNSGGSLGDLHHHHHQHGLAPSALPASDSQQQQQSLTSSTSSSTSQQQAIPRNITHRKGQNIVTATSANRNSTVRMSMTSSASISPTTANFSVVTGSPASLFLRPEHEVHLGDMDTFSLDFGRIEEGDQGDDW